MVTRGQLRALLLVSGLHIVSADFVYVDFNSTLGLEFNGHSTTTSCEEADESVYIAGKYYEYGENYDYSEGHGAADTTPASTPEKLAESVTHIETETVETNVHESSLKFRDFKAVFGHRDVYRPRRKTRCPLRARLTPSNPHTRGSVWHTNPMPVLLGFETKFTFQITDLTRICTQVKDSTFQTKHHESCRVQGGDGFAFVVQGDLNTTAALGLEGGQMGYGGIRNSLAVEFDTWHNANSTDPWVDHISVHGAPGSVPNTALLHASRLSVPAPFDLADGAVHSAKIVYYPYVNNKYLTSMTGSEALLPFLRDDADSRRVGTLVVWMDEGVEADVPLLAIPLNLGLLLELHQGVAHVGFTSSTGDVWEKHDVLGWYFCEDPPCSELDGTFDFDYHTQSLRWSAPGDAHSIINVPDHTPPDTTPTAAPMQHFAHARQEGLSPSYTGDEVVDP